MSAARHTGRAYPSKKPELVPASVQPRAHAVTLLRRWRDMDGGRQRQTADPRKGVCDDCTLDFQLPLIRDVCEQTSTAKQIGVVFPAIGRRLFHRDRLREGNGLAHAFDAGPHTLARNRAADEHNLPVGPGDHPSAHGRLVNRQQEDLPRCNHVEMAQSRLQNRS